MKKILAIAVAAMAFSMIAPQSQVSAQTYQDSYRFGVGLSQSRGFPYPNQTRRARGFFNLGGIGFSPRLEEPPYFAKYPPVHYSGVVPRPYGISPYAVPPGIMPVEMSVPHVPQTIENPYYQESEVDTAPPLPTVDGIPEPTPATPAKKTGHKVASVKNPFYNPISRR